MIRRTSRSKEPTAPPSPKTGLCRSYGSSSSSSHISRSSSNVDNNSNRVSRLKKFNACLWAVALFTFLILFDSDRLLLTSPIEDVETRNSTDVNPAPAKHPVPAGKPTMPLNTPSPTASPVLADPTPVPTPQTDITSNTDPTAELDPDVDQPTSQNDIVGEIPSEQTSNTNAPSQNEMGSGVGSEPTPAVAEPTNPTNPPDGPSHNDVSPPSPTSPTQPNQPLQRGNYTVSKLDFGIDLPVAAQEFMDQHCILSPLNRWYPAPPPSNDDWQVRAPYFIVAGVWNAGIHSLSKALLNHPQIANHQDLVKVQGHFKPKDFPYTQSMPSSSSALPSSNSTSKSTTRNKKITVKVGRARERMFAQMYKSTSYFINNPGHVAFDAGPGYLFHADPTAYSILCTTPWSKLVVVLRDPVERVYQQWAYATEFRHFNVPLEDMIARDMHSMRINGLIQTKGENDDQSNVNDNESTTVGTVTTTTEKTEQEAWDSYRAPRQTGNLVGRSLYELQLREWFEIMKQAGKEPKDHVFIMTSEDWFSPERGHDEYLRLLEFLGLSTTTTTTTGATSTTSSTSTASSTSSSWTVPSPKLQSHHLDKYEPMSDETRTILNDFFQPYNDKLFQLLTEYGYAEQVEQWKLRNIWGRGGKNK